MIRFSIITNAHRLGIGILHNTIQHHNMRAASGLVVDFWTTYQALSRPASIKPILQHMSDLLHP